MRLAAVEQQVRAAQDALVQEAPGAQPVHGEDVDVGEVGELHVGLVWAWVAGRRADARRC